MDKTQWGKHLENQNWGWGSLERHTQEDMSSETKIR